MSDEKSPLLSTPSKTGSDKFTLVIHGGAGTMDRARSTPEQRARYRRVLEQALRAGHAVLAGGGEAMDAAVVAVTVLEGRGACDRGADARADPSQTARSSTRARARCSMSPARQAPPPPSTRPPR
jgi:beta-aspartyl-peptidase (threonine type)